MMQPCVNVQAETDACLGGCDGALGLSGMLNSRAGRSLGKGREAVKNHHLQL